MPRYTADPTQVSASLVILPKDEYEFVVGRPKAFERTAAAGHQSYGVRFPLVVVGGPKEGKRTVFSIYLHSDGGASMGKRFQMAVAGHTVNQENEAQFDLDAAGQDWTYDTDDGSVGEAYQEYEGKHVCCSVDVEMIEDKKTGKEQESQTWGVWMPVGQ